MEKEETPGLSRKKIPIMESYIHIQPICILCSQGWNAGYTRIWGHNGEPHLSTLTICQFYTQQTTAANVEVGTSLTSFLWEKNAFTYGKPIHVPFESIVLSYNLIKMQKFSQLSPTSKWPLEKNPCENRSFLQLKGQTGEKPHFHILPGIHLCTHPGRSYWHTDSWALLLVANY